MGTLKTQLEGIHLGLINVSRSLVTNVATKGQRNHPLGTRLARLNPTVPTGPHRGL